MALGYIILTSCYYANLYNGRDLKFMSTSLFGSDGSTYDQSAVLTDNKLDPSKLANVGLPRYTTTYAVSQLAYNLSMGAAITHVLLWSWPDLKKGKCMESLSEWARH